MKFEVGERVQVIANGKLQVGEIYDKWTGTGVKNDYVVKLDEVGSRFMAEDRIAKLDQPKLVVVPKFVADWLEEHKESPDLVENYTEKDALANTIHFTIYCLFADFPNTNPDVELRKPVCEWLEEDRSNYFKLIDAVHNGYVVEEEPRYYVKLPGRIGYLRKSIGFPTTVYKTDADQYTEKEIKAIDERYWAFAVPVEEVEAE